jgi:hypothetical protein
MLNTNQPAVERKEFKIHSAVLGHFIHSQAGSAGKAIIELIQNSIDAGATQCSIEISRTGFFLRDDGHGFATIQDVELFFATFGTSHIDGDAKFGRFRVGRGQIMGFASTVWQSNQFQMAVDIKTIGYGFDLSSMAEALPGCKIEGMWYEPLILEKDEEFGFEDDQFETLLGEIRNLVGYTPLNVILNGNTISRSLDAEPWDVETEDAYIRVKPTGPLIIYNQGILVREDSGHHWGCGGIVVTKKAIKLNISRTEILRKDCPVWQVIAKEVKKLSQKIRRNQNGRLDENGRIRAARELLSGNGDITARTITILPRDHISLKELVYKKGQLVVANDKEIRIGEKIAQSGLAVVLHPDMFYRFDCSDSLGLEQALKTAWRRNAGKESAHYLEEHYLSRFAITPFTEARQSFFEESKLLELNEVNKDLQCIFRAIKAPARKVLWKAAGRNGIYFVPQIKIGRADIYAAWTDSKNYVAINETLLEEILTDGRTGLLKLMHIMVHEACHAGDGDSREAAHDDIFYRRFHDCITEMSYFMEKQIRRTVWNYLRVCQRDKIKPRGWASRDFFHRRKTSKHL